MPLPPSNSSCDRSEKGRFPGGPFTAAILSRSPPYATCFASFPIKPLARPIIINSAGTACPTITMAPKPRKIQPINPVFSIVPVVAAKAAAGVKTAIDPMMVVSVLMTSSFGWWLRFCPFVIYEMHRRCQRKRILCMTLLTIRYNGIFYCQSNGIAVDPGGNKGAGVYDIYTASGATRSVKRYEMGL